MKTLALALLALSAPGVAHAGHTCGGGGGGSSGGGSSSSSSSSSGSYSGGSSYTPSGGGVATQAATGCIDDTDVVGYRHCTKYGEWAKNLEVPHIFLELGTSVRQFASGLPNQQGRVTHGYESFAYRVVMPEPQGSGTAMDTAMTTTFRLGVSPTHNFYTAAELEIGGMTSTAAASTEMMSSEGAFGSPQLVQRGGLMLGAYAVAGVRGRVQGWSLAIEGAGGLRAAFYDFDSTYHACESSSTIEVSRGVVEARARAETWLGPWITFGGALGANVLARGDWLGGIYFGFHSRAYAGGR